MTVKGELFQRTNRSRPCPTCGKTDWCLVGEAACLCARVESEDRRGGAGWLHRQRGGPVSVPKKPSDGVDLRAVAEGYAKSMTDGIREKLARHLGLPPDAMHCFTLLGLGKDEDGTGWATFPEYAADGRVVGILRRYQDGKKLQLPGGFRGLSVPRGFNPASAKRVFVVEGPTDVAAVTAAGLLAVGRPSNSGGVDELVGLLWRCPDQCRITVVGENDCKDDGLWPGLSGATSVAGQLADKLGRRPGMKKSPVTWALCPDGAKDVRAWLTQRVKPDDGREVWSAAGEMLAEGLADNGVIAEGLEATVRKVVAENVGLRRRMAEVETQMRKLQDRFLSHPDFRAG